MVVGVELRLTSNSLIKLSSNTSEVFELRFIFLLDFLIHLLRLALEVLDIGQEAVVDRALEFFVIVNVLNDPVNSVFKGADDDLVGLDLDAGLLDHRLHLFLALAKVVDEVT